MRTKGLPVKRLLSCAYHDASFMGRKVPNSMIFMPCQGPGSSSGLICSGAWSGEQCTDASVYTCDTGGFGRSV